MTSPPKFPLPKGYFTLGMSNDLLPTQEAHYKSIAQGQVDAILQAEHEFTHSHKCQVSSRKWRLVRKEHKLRIYRRRSGSLGPADQHVLPSLLSVGQVNGTLDELLYGLHTKSHEELQATMSYMDANVKDSTVLHNIEVATPTDPFHYLGLKWTLTRLPSTMLAKPRDWCYVEAMGLGRDRQGQRFGYAIMHSVELPNCPAFDDRVAVRAQGSFGFIFRELVAGTIEVYAQGLYDPAGEVIPHVSVTMTIEIFARLSKTSQCAEAKKLTTMAVRHFRETAIADQQQLQNRCYLCVKGSGMFASLKMCNVCGATACAKCRVKKVVFTGVSNALCEIACCKTCILQAKNLGVSPVDESFVLQTTDHQKLVRDTIFQGNHQWSFASSDSDRRFSSQERELNETSDEDVQSLSGASEKDFEKIIDGMIERKFMTMSQQAMQFASQSESPRGHRRMPSYGQSAVSGSPRGHRRVQSWGPTVVPVSPPLSPELHEFPARVHPQSTISSEQAELFNRMLALQNAAHHVYAMTQANQEMMNKL